MSSFVIITEAGEAEGTEWRIMDDEAGKRDLGRFFSDKFRKLVRYFQANYADLSDMEGADAHAI